MKRIVFAAALVWAFAGGRAAAGEKLVIASCNFEPYYGETLKDSGPLAAVTKQALEKAGYQVEVKILPWARVLKEAEAGKVDVVFGLWKSADRESWAAWSVPLVDNEIGLYKRRGDAFIDLAGLKGAGGTLGSVRGYANPPAVAASGVALDEATDDEANLKKLLAGRVKVALIDKYLGTYLAGKLGKAQELEWVTTLERKPLVNAVVKTSGKDWKKILADLDREVTAMQAKGAIAQIFKQSGLQ